MNLNDIEWENMSEVIQIVEVTSGGAITKYYITRDLTTGNIEFVEREVIDSSLMDDDNYLVANAFSHTLINYLNVDQIVFDMEEDTKLTLHISMDTLHDIDCAYAWKNSPYLLTYKLLENRVTI